MPEHCNLTPLEFQPAVDFASAYYDKIRNTGASRDFNNPYLIRSEGDSIADTLMGKFAELMFQKFIMDRCGVLLPLDFEIRPQTDGGQDIPDFHLKMDIKATKIYSDYLMVEKDRLISDVYVMIRVDMPRAIESWNTDVLHYYCRQQTSINGVICGYAFREDFWDGDPSRPYIAYEQGSKLIRSDFFKHIPVEDWSYEGIRKRMKEDARHLMFIGPPLKAELNYALPYFKLREDWEKIIFPDSNQLQIPQKDLKQ